MDREQYQILGLKLFFVPDIQLNKILLKQTLSQVIVLDSFKKFEISYKGTSDQKYFDPLSAIPALI